MTEKELIMIVAYIVVFFIGIAIMRAVFSIGTIVKHLRAQTRLLAYLCEKAGVEPTTIKSIINEVNEVL